MRRRAPFAWLVVGVLVLAGCSEPQQANDTLPTAPATTSAEPTLEPLGPADFPVPDDARVQTEAGAIAMATYYLDLADYLLVSLDPQSLRELSSGCENCEQIAAGYDADRSAANRYEGCDLSIVSVGTVTSNDSTADVPLVIQQAACRIIGPDNVEITGRASPDLQLSGGMAFQWDPIREAWIATQLNAERL